jgi:hypothetical protein
MKKNIFILILLVAYPAPAGVISGSIIVFNFTKDRIVVAADSLAGNNDSGIPDYSRCKIAAFGHQLIFTTIGNVGWSNSAGQGSLQAWDNMELARNIIHSKRQCCTDLDGIASQWAQDVKSRWDLVNQLDRQRAMNIASANAGQFTAGIFIGKNLTMKLEIVGYNMNNALDPVEIKTGDGAGISPCWPCGQLQGGRICAAGHHLDVAAKFCSERKHGDTIDVRTRLNGASESTKLAVKVVEMTIDAYEKVAGDVGGKVDSITMTKEGTITWNSRKTNCPNNQN